MAEEIAKHRAKNRRKNRHKDLLKGCLAVISPLFKHKITVVSQHIVTAERAGADLHFFIIIAAPKRIYFLLRDFFNQAEIFKMSQVIANLPALLWMQQRDIRDLGDEFMAMMASGQVDAVSAYEAIRARKNRTSPKPPSTGGLGSDGGKKPAYFTKEQVDAMSDAEIDKNYDAIRKSMMRW